MDEDEYSEIPYDHESLDELAASISFEDWGQDR